MTGMAPAHCILGQFLGVVRHCFPPPLDVPTFAARYLYVRNDARDPSSEIWKCGREIYPVILPKFRLPRKFRDLLHAANLRHGTDGFSSPPKEGVLRVFSSYTELYCTQNMHCIVSCVGQMYVYVLSVEVDRHVCGILVWYSVSYVTVSCKTKYKPVYLYRLYFKDVCGGL